MKKILLSLSVLIASLLCMMWVWWFEDNKVYAQENNSTCDTCNATPEQLLQYRDLVVYILKNIPTTPKTNLKNLTWNYATTIVKSTVQYFGDQADKLFWIWTETLRKDIVTDFGLDFIQNLFTSFRSRVYLRDLAKMKIIDDMIHTKAAQIIADGRRDDDINSWDLAKIKNHISNSKVFSNFDMQYSGYADMISFLYVINNDIKTWISFWTMSKDIWTNNIKATFNQTWIDWLEGSYNCIRWSFSCNTESKSFVSNLNWVWKKITSDWKNFTRRISTSAKKFKNIKFRWYFQDTKLVQINTSVTNPFNQKDIQDIAVQQKQIKDNVLWKTNSLQQLPCVSDDILSSNLSTSDAAKITSVCQNMMWWVHNIIQSSEKADIYSAISDPRVITKLFASLSQKVDLARWDNQWWLGGVIKEAQDMCISVCSNLNDNITCSW